MKVDINGKRLNLISVYAPNNPSDRRKFFSDSLSAHLSLDSQNIVAGDFNCEESISMEHSL